MGDDGDGMVPGSPDHPSDRLKGTGPNRPVPQPNLTAMRAVSEHSEETKDKSSVVLLNRLVRSGIFAEGRAYEVGTDPHPHGVVLKQNLDAAADQVRGVRLAVDDVAR